MTYHKLNNPPQVGLDSDIHCMDTIGNNIQTLIANLKKGRKAA